MDQGMSLDILIRYKYQNRSSGYLDISNQDIMIRQSYPINSCKSQVSVAHETGTDHAAF